MTNDQPTQPLTDAELAGAKARTRLAKECQDSHLGAMACRAVIRDSVCANGHMQHRSRAEVDAYRDREALLVEVDRLRSALTALGRNESAAANRALALQEEIAAGNASDGYHTHAELYDYRMLYNAHAAAGWLDAGYRVVKSWKHSDGELCFGGGWFVVCAELPTGQVTNHYEAKHWDLFVIPEETPPVYDGHSPTDASHRLRQSLGWVVDH